MDTEQYITSEVDRQKSTNYEGMRQALVSAKRSRLGFDIDSPETLGHFVCHLAHKIDPENTYHAGTDLRNLRLSNVGFANGGTAAKAAEVPELFQRWCNMAMVVLKEKFDPSYRADVDLLTKMLLQIHPWKDGNGRTASILRNWMLGTLDDPTPLPDFQF